jgi:outer membrane lipoprotein LolB
MRMTAALAGLFVAACATRPPPASGSPWILGRMSVHVAAAGGEAARAMSAAFELRGTGDAGELRLDTPLGTTMASAVWAPGVALLRTSDGERRFDNLDDLSFQVLGEAMPLAALPDWLAGRPWPGASFAKTASGFEQLGWRVEIGRAAQGSIEARRDAPPAVVVRAQLDTAQ